MASEGGHKKDKLKLFGMDLTNYSLDEYPATSYLAAKTLANKQSHDEVPKLAASSASRSTSTAQGPNAHKNVQTPSKSIPTADFLTILCWREWIYHI